MKKRILITGAAGFIGFHLSQHLLNDRNTEILIGLDNFNDYYNIALKRNRAKVLADQNMQIIEGDICHPTLFSQIVQDQHITHVVHLAAQAGVRYSLKNPQAYVTANLEGFVNVLEGCRLIPEIKLIYASSSSVYGLNTKIPFSIEDNTDKQASLYGATKKANELMAHTYHHLYGLNVIGLRFFTVYGPWGRPDMAYFTFTKAIEEGQPIDLYNNGEMMRDFTYIDDIVQGIISALDLESGCEVFNLGNNRPISLNDFIGCIEKSLNKQAIKRYLPMQPGDVVNTYADISYSQQKLNFNPRIGIDEGINKFVKWYKSYYK